VTLLLISTCWRYTPSNHPSGRLIVFDINKNDIIRSCEIIEPPYRFMDPNPRGGFRGLKGIAVHEDFIAIANASTIFIYDKNWNLIKYFWHPSCAGIHDIIFQNESIWVTSTRNDLLFQFDFNGRITNFINFRDFHFINSVAPQTSKNFLSKKMILEGKINFRDPRTHDHAFCDLLHVNSLAFLDKGDLLISCGLIKEANQFQFHQLINRVKMFDSLFLLNYLHKLYEFLPINNKNKREKNGKFQKRHSKSLIIKLSKHNEIIGSFIIDNCSVPSHSLRILDRDSAIYLNSTSGELIFLDTSKTKFLYKTKVESTFLRGVTILDDKTIFLGDNNYLIHYNLLNNKISTRTLISDDPNEAIFEIDILPDNFTLPPKSFLEHHHNLNPISQK